MKLDLYEKMEILQNCDIKNIQFAQTHLDVDFLKTNVVSIDDKDKTQEAQEKTSEDDFQLMETEEFLSQDIQNVINISENQIVKIEYQNSNGTINTEYIVNHGDYLDINPDLEENLYEEHVPYKVLAENNEQDIDCTSIQQANGDVTNVSQEIFEVSADGELYLPTTNDVSEQMVPTDSNSSGNHLQTPALSPASEEETSNAETDLTSLNWLHNITNIMSVPNLPTPPVSPKPKKKSNGSGQEDLTININFYKKNGDKKPPFSYATLICMAMGKNGNKMTLSAIYHWIRENFLYYRKAHPSWQVGERCFFAWCFVFFVFFCVSIIFLLAC